MDSLTPMLHFSSVTFTCSGIVPKMQNWGGRFHKSLIKICVVLVAVVEISALFMTFVLHGALADWTWQYLLGPTT
jgi:uncharacterized membrane protein